ncbi:division/cell wall cluster transcriptional repressor MraZ [Schleiferia thermophila]|uniref:Transcriptional regulator MraZ n=1 Tax=Schleiferia thermophila TaxID=884107 RepID=A0A369A5W4_9FLAO|nr:division/cell wall cluster transcriptional repressor MraZ [Schleiferia thermophila]KFD38793.1 MraZ family transcriptional regulator [Schleiferia thermophila str. Yellowstone]PMB31350.1 division/cell wall cluster transcriptional repressor MraZ [Fischerella thermalis CCMEE 5319]RCX04742.1 MraZ protein [Schleiferia thermophila]GCD79729.1 transcriptional regulator MraZ [Schleiferia thermophila]
MNLIGVHELKADEKARILLPSALKKQLLPYLEDGFILKRSVFQKCLELYPMKEWDKIMAKLNKLNRFVKKNNDFIRMYTAGVRIVEIDANGRLLIPKDLVNYAGIQGEIVLNAMGAWIEIWDREAYESTINDPRVDFASLAEEVMGSLGDDLQN